MQTQLYKKSLQVFAKSLLEKEQENLRELGSLFGFSGIYLLQFKLVAALSELADLLVSQASSVAEIHQCLFKIGQLYRAISIKKKQSEREQRQIAFYLTELDFNRQSRLLAQQSWELKVQKYHQTSFLYYVFSHSVSMLQSLKDRLQEKLDALKELVMSLFSSKKEDTPESSNQISFGERAKQGFAVLLKHGSHCKHYCPAFALSRAQFLLRKERPAPVCVPSQDLRRNLGLAY